VVSNAKDKPKDELSAEIRRKMKYGDFWKQYLKEAIRILGQEEDPKHDNEPASADEIKINSEASKSKPKGKVE